MKTVKRDRGTRPAAKSIENDPPHDADRFEIGLRAYVVDPSLRQRAEPYRVPPGPSEYTLVFDTETTADSRLNLRFGCYHVYRNQVLIRKGLFFNSKFLKPQERSTISHYADRHHFELMAVGDFIDKIFFGIGYDFRASIVGLNLPFDISRLAGEYSTARVSEARSDLGMRGAFSFRLSRDRWRPRVQVKHQSQRLAFIRFTAPPDVNAARSSRKYHKRGPVRRGFFIDLKTIGDALTSQSNSLESLAAFLGVSPKRQTIEHGKDLADSYLDYATGDVQSTWECFLALRTRFETHRLRGTHLHSIYSEASLGKAYLKQMGIASWMVCQPHFPQEMIGRIMSTYYGGRAEVHIRRQIVQVSYCDFRSMYPTVCTLMRLWDFVTASGVNFHDSTAATRRLLRDVDLAQLQKPEFWPDLRTIVQIRADRDILPVRAKYQGMQFNIGVNYVSSEIPLWYTLADCIASKLLTGKTPDVIQAYSFSPEAPQLNLRKVSILGRHDYEIDPTTQDFYKRLIDLRATVQEREAAVSDTTSKVRLNIEQQAIKILANATSYGIFVELNVEELAREKPLRRYGFSGEATSIRSPKREKPGSYFHPLLGTLITGAARLMLAITESLAKINELEWAFCDTDSMALANLAGFPCADFFARAERVCNWFRPLNPYESKSPLVKVEDENRRLEGSRLTDNLEPLFCYAVSAKRYCLFNVDSFGKPVLRKGLAHGLGHLYRPYEDNAAPREFPAPAVPLTKLGINRWQHDLWYRIISAALADNDTESNPALHSAFNAPAANRYHATTPEILGWFKSYNAQRPFAEQVKPFNFLLSYQARPITDQLWTSSATERPAKRHRRTRTPQYPKPVAPYDNDPRRGALKCFDRVSGKPVAIEFLQTYSESLAQYHLHAEPKFRKAKGRDNGLTERRHIMITARDIHYIGKEANELEEQIALGADPDAIPAYGTEVDIYAHTAERVLKRLSEHTPEQVARTSGFTGRYVRAVRDGERHPKLTAFRKLESALARLEEQKASEHRLLAWLRDYTEVSRREVARQLGEDRRNLDKVLSGERGPSSELLHNLAVFAAARGFSTN